MLLLVSESCKEILGLACAADQELLHKMPLSGPPQLHFIPGTHPSQPGLFSGGRRRSIPVPVGHRHDGPAAGGEQAAAPLRLTQRCSRIGCEMVWPIHLRSAVSYDGVVKRTKLAAAFWVGHFACAGSRISKPEQSAAHVPSNQKTYQMHQC